MSFTYNGYTLNEYLEEPWYDTEINLLKVSYLNYLTITHLM